MKTAITNTDEKTSEGEKSIEERFADAFLNQDVEAIAELLSEEGQYEIRNYYVEQDHLEEFDGNKYDYLHWLKRLFDRYKAEKTPVESISLSHDFCTRCFDSCPVIKFKAPFIPGKNIVLKQEYNKIVRIQYCLNPLSEYTDAPF